MHVLSHDLLNAELLPSISARVIGLFGKARKTVALCHARSCLIMFPAAVSSYSRERFGEANDPLSVDDPSTGVADGVGIVVSINEGKTALNTRFFEPISPSFYRNQDNFLESLAFAF